MAANVLVTPKTLYGDATDTGVTVDFGRWMGSVALLNLDSTNGVWVKFDVTGVSMTAGNLADQIYLPPGGPGFNIPIVQFSKIGGICSAGKTATFIAVATPSAQSGRRK